MTVSTNFFYEQIMLSIKFICFKSNLCFWLFWANKSPLKLEFERLLDQSIVRPREHFCIFGLKMSHNGPSDEYRPLSALHTYNSK